MPKLRLPVFGPFFLALYPILFIYSLNLSKVDVQDVVVAAVISLLLIGLLLVINWRIFKQPDRALFVTSLVVFLLFNYGHFYNSLSWMNTEGRLPVSVHVILLALWGLLLAVGVLVARTRTRYLPAVNRYVSLIFGCLMVITLASIALTGVPVSALGMVPDLTVEAQAPDVPPDIYYIVIDEYASNHMLQTYLGYDNSAFLTSLRDRGFYVADEAHANYYNTNLSLASSLNMAYLDFLNDQPNGEPLSISLIYNNITVQGLKRLGYTYLHFVTEYSVTRNAPQADVIYYGYDPDVFKLVNLNEFFVTLGNTTILAPVMNVIYPRDRQAKTYYNLQKLAEISRMPQPSFTFAHLVTAHTPYAFGKQDGPVNPNGRAVDGTIIDPDKYAWKADYVDSVIFTNRVVSQVIDTILEQSDVEPIILIQGDHGFRWLCDDCLAEVNTWDDRYYAEVVLPILSAYYLPDDGASVLYPGITPVNSFRVIFDRYFGTQLGQLEDRHYRVKDYYTKVYDFMDITAVVNDSVTAQSASE